MSGEYQVDYHSEKCHLRLLIRKETLLFYKYLINFFFLKKKKRRLRTVCAVSIKSTR